MVGREVDTLVHGIVCIFEIDAEIAMHSCIAVNAYAESLLGHLIHHAFAEFDDVFLKRFVARRII